MTSSGVCLDLSDTQKQLQETAKQFAEKVIKPQAAAYDRSMEYPQPIFEEAWKLGLCNMHLPEECGGANFSVMDGVIVAEELAWGCTGISTAMEANSLASAPVLVAGTTEQKKKWLGMLSEAPIQAAYCVTEPGAGSDVAGLKTTAKKVGDKYIINGQKMWITGGGVAKWFFVLTKCEGKFTGFVVDGDSPGITRGPKEVNMGQRCSDTRGITFNNVEVPEANRLGQEGDGFKIAMGAFDHTRPPVAMGAVGLARRAMEESIAYAKDRHTMGKPIAEHQAVAFMIAEMASGIEAARYLVYKSAFEADQGRRNTFFASMAKQFAADHCQKVCADAVQVFGGNGFNTGYPVEKLYRDCKIFQIYEGTSQIQKLIVSRALLDTGKKK